MEMPASFVTPPRPRNSRLITIPMSFSARAFVIPSSIIDAEHVSPITVKKRPLNKRRMICLIRKRLTSSDSRRKPGGACNDDVQISWFGQNCLSALAQRPGKGVRAMSGITAQSLQHPSANLSLYLVRLHFARTSPGNMNRKPSMWYWYLPEPCRSCGPKPDNQNVRDLSR